MKPPFDQPRLLIILASTRQGRQGESVAAWVTNLAVSGRTFETRFVDLRDWSLPYYDEPTSPMDGQYPRYAREWAQEVEWADAYLVVTPEYTNGYPAVLKSALDAVYVEWNNKPIAFVGYSSADGGSRAIEQLRQVVIELQMAPIRECVVVTNVQDAFTVDDQPLDADLNAQADSMLNQLTWWARALRTAREEAGLESAAEAV